jgi:hypothetical protein
MINEHKPLLWKPKKRSKAGIHGDVATQRGVSRVLRDCCGEKILVVINMGFRNIGWPVIVRYSSHKRGNLM